MIGLFQEYDPCRINNDNSTNVTLNPFSWNNEVNMLYIDQLGFSFGNRTIGASHQPEAAEDAWTWMQTFSSDCRFSRLQNCTLAIRTESKVLSSPTVTADWKYAEVWRSLRTNFCRVSWFKFCRSQTRAWLLRAFYLPEYGYWRWKDL